MEQFIENCIAHIANENDTELFQLAIPKPEYFNWVVTVFENIHVKQRPDAVALIWTDATTTVQRTFEQMLTTTNQLLNLFRDKGIHQHDKVLTLLGMQEINWYAILACIKGGYQLITAATILGVQDIKYRCEMAMPKVIIAAEDQAEKFEEVEQLLGQNFPLKIIAEGTRSGWISFEAINDYPITAEPALTKADDLLFLFFTSGTTGLPKIVKHTHYSYPVGSLTTAAWIGLRTGDVHCNISQPGWAKFTWSSFFAPWLTGATIFAFAQKGRFVAKDMLHELAKHKITTFCAPPTVLRMLILEDLTQYKFHFRQCVAAGEPLNPEIIDIWKQHTGITIRDGFGQTESTAMIANLPNKVIKYGSMGMPTFLYDIVIADDDGNILPDNEEGNICVRNNNAKPNGLFQGYLGDPNKEMEVFKHDLYYTGDKAYKDEDGYIWFVGRNDDVIKTSDYRVGPFEVESVLLEHPSVQESAVVGSPHPVKGYVVKAFVILKDSISNEEQTAKALFDYCKENIAPYKMPRIIEFVDELPKTISGKIRRVELRAIEAQQKAMGSQSNREFLL